MQKNMPEQILVALSAINSVHPTMVEKGNTFATILEGVPEEAWKEVKDAVDNHKKAFPEQTYDWDAYLEQFKAIAAGICVQ